MKSTEDTTGRRSINAAMLGENVIWMLDKGETILRNWHAWNHFYKAIFKDICSSNVTDPQGYDKVNEIMSSLLIYSIISENVKC